MCYPFFYEFMNLFYIYCIININEYNDIYICITSLLLVHVCRHIQYIYKLINIVFQVYSCADMCTSMMGDGPGFFILVLFQVPQVFGKAI